MNTKDKLIFLPFDGLLRIWKSVYKEKPDARSWLNQLDDKISSRKKVVVKDGKLMVQLSTEEINKLRDLYELEI